MATRKPLVIVGGKPCQLPAGDALAGASSALVAPVSVSGSYTLLDTSATQYLSATAATALSLPASPVNHVLDVVVSQSDNFGITWPLTVNWLGAAAPFASQEGVTVRLVRLNGTWYATNLELAGVEFTTTRVIAHGFGSFAEPVGIAEGDMVVAITHGPTSSVFGAGWTVEPETPLDSSFKSHCGYRRRGATPIASMNFTTDGSASFWAVLRGCPDVERAVGTLVNNGATSMAEAAVRDGFVLTWAFDRDYANSVVGATIAQPSASLLNLTRDVAYYKGQVKCGPISAGQNVTVTDTGGSYTTNSWRIFF